MATKSELYGGLMSGTSLDGVDAVLVDFSGHHPVLKTHVYMAYAPELRKELLLLNTAGWDDLHRAAVAEQHLARLYAAAVFDALRHAEVDAGAICAVGVHGQTIRHRPDAGYTLQLNSPAMLAELTGIDVIADFRSRDIAAGGQGAPLVPAFHAAMFTHHEARVIVNLGGISNITGLPARESGGKVIGFDCGPGNVLIDLWAQAHSGELYDRDGHWAASGHTEATLLKVMLEEPYFGEPPPKSTGRELFNMDWLTAKLAGRRYDARNVQATLTRLTAVTIGQAIEKQFPRAADVVACGGGVYNKTLMRMLAEECAPRPVVSSETLGVAPEHVEAMSFAWLAREHIARRPGNLPAVTGARGPRVLGALYPA
ncbi:MAG TPA: anhydro-N-acetylmuramic acid kinase [Burkholderiaceae bacterium]|nr:anhydro-N-acetylmuramic acid kinase [Burkholderiaceae bacterium]